MAWRGMWLMRVGIGQGSEGCFESGGEEWCADVVGIGFGQHGGNEPRICCWSCWIAQAMGFN